MTGFGGARPFFLTSVLALAACSANSSAGPDGPRAVGSASAAPTQLDLQLTPKPDRREPARVGTVDVSLGFSALEVPSQATIVQLALIADNVDTVATSLSNLKITDAAGDVVIRSRDIDRPVLHARDSESGGVTREWYADRSISGPVTVTYTVPGHATLPPRGPAGPLSFRDDEGGVSAAGHVFLLTPPGDTRYKVKIGWDLSHLSADSIGVSSLGVGTVTSPTLMSANELRMSYFMGGKVQQWRDSATPHFFGSWQGTAPFDAAELLQWTSKLHGHYRALFGQSAPEPYGVFLRYNPINAGGGTGFFRSFVATYGVGRANEADELKVTLSHEMFHTFSPYISQPAGKASSWFGEGLATYYGGALAFRFGLISPEHYLDDVNYTASRYYSSIMATLPNDQIADRFWNDTRVRTLAYDRGMLYFVTVDEALRKKSGNRQSLDDLMLAMKHREDGGKDLTNADWEDVLRQHLGESAVADFRAFMAGKMPIPSSDAFGPCFTRTTKTVRRYESGYDPSVLAEPRRIVRGLIPGSAADKAGLRNGDEIVKPVPQDGIQGDQDRTQTLEIKRGARQFKITYLPRGETVDVYQWAKRPGIDAGHCKPLGRS